MNIFTALLLLSLSILAFPSRISAACTSSPSGDLPGWGSTVTLSSCNKTIAGVTGADYATSETSTANTSVLTLSGTTSLTINNGGTLAVGSLNVGSGTTISLATGAQIKTKTPIYIPDGDADGWASTAITSATLYTATSSGRRRLAFMRGYTADCGDTQYATNNSCCTVDTYYIDADGDGYGAGAGTQMCSSAGYVTNNLDCDDANASIKTIVATGGTITTVGSDKVHTFTGSGTFSISCGAPKNVQVLVVAGGGGGGGGSGGIASAGGSGGGGQAVYNAAYLASGSISVTVGASGARGRCGGPGDGCTYANPPLIGGNGGNSVFGTMTASGGGGGGIHGGSGQNGGTGGGGGTFFGAGGTGTSGYNGGQGGDCNTPCRSGGGGGAGQAGSSSVGSGTGNGGNGYYSAISGTGTYYGGGGGGTQYWTAHGIAGLGGGASGLQCYINGSTGCSNGKDGTLNTGGGGSGGSGGEKGWGGLGGSGIVIVRYTNP